MLAKSELYWSNARWIHRIAHMWSAAVSVVNLQIYILFIHEIVFVFG